MYFPECSHSLMDVKTINATQKVFEKIICFINLTVQIVKLQLIIIAHAVQREHVIVSL